MNSEKNSFCNILKDKFYGQVHSQKYQRLLQEYESIANVFLGMIFWGTISSPKASRNCLWWSHFLTKTQIRLANSLKLNYTPSQIFLQECFEASFENFGKYAAKRIQLSFLWIKLHHYSLQPTTGPKTLLQIIFLEVLRNHCKIVPFTLTL